MLTFRPFDPPYAYRDGEPLPVSGRKPLAVLVYLALEDRPVSRAELTDLLWPDADHSNARHSLRQALSTLRDAIDGLDVGGDPLFVSGDDLEQDWRTPAPCEDCSRLIAELRGVAGRAWEHWLDDTEESLRDRAAAALERRFRDEIDASRWDAAADAAGALVRVRPGRAASWRRLAQAHLWNGDSIRAAEVLEDAAADLPRDEYGKLQGLKERIDEINARAAGGHARGHGAVLLGRHDEMAELRALARETAAGTGQAAAIVAPVGLGKTRLAGEFAARLQADDWTIVSTAATRAEAQLRFSVLGPLVRNLLRQRGAAAISPASEVLLHALVPSRSGLDGLERIEPAALSDALLDLLDNVAFETPLLVVLDDVQWADGASLGVISNVLRAIQDSRIFLLFCSDDRPAGPVDWLPDLVRRIELEPLSEAQVRELLSMAGAPDDDVAALARGLHAQSGGNPLFIAEFLEGVRERGIESGIDNEPGIDWAEAVRRSRLPHGIEQVIRRRLAVLDEDSRRLLRQLLEGPRDVASLQLRSTGAAGLDARLLHLLDAGILHWTAEGQVDFRHDFVRRQLAAEEEARRQRRLRRVYAAAGSLFVAALLVLVGFAVSTPGHPPFGGGRILLVRTDGVHRVEVGSGSPDRWAMNRLDNPASADPQLWDVSTDGDGELVYWGYGVEDGGPDVLRLYPDGRPAETLVARPGDDTWQAASPDSRYFLHMAENPETVHYDTHLYRRRIDGSDPTLIRGGQTWLDGAEWSPDGRRILYSVRSARDTLVAANPMGDVLWQRELGTIHRAAWCGGGDEIVAIVRGGRTAVLVSVRPGVDAPDTLAAPVTAGAVTCSPDGSAVLYGAIREGRETLALLDRSSGVEHVTGWPLTRRLEWIPDEPRPYPAAVTIVHPPEAIPWGDQRPLRAAAVLTSGRVEPTGEVAWRSLDPGVVSVSPDGTVFANSPGTARVIAVLDGWLADTVSIRVDGRAKREPLLDDPFEAWDPGKWIAVGDPRPTIVEEGLDISGDGSFVDGVYTREDYSLSTGATAELEFRLPFTRRDRQSITLCIGTYEITEGHDGDAFNEWTTADEICVTYPAGELHKFDPSIAGFEHQTVPIPGTVEPGDWTHLALQMQPDGRVDLFMDRTFVARSLRQFDATAGKRWRIRILGRGVDTQLVIRSFVLWPVARFPVPRDGA